MREEKDKIGERLLEDDTLYGIQTARALDNFQISGRRVHLKLVYAIATVKKAAALTHASLGLMEDEKADAIVRACDALLAGEADGALVTDALQGGAGTSTNMNVNEVVANLALGILKEPPGASGRISPLDDVNRGQSTNDVYPTALRIAAVQMVRQLSGECARLQESLQKKEQEYADILKLGRTELMDAMPVTLGQEFGAFAQAISRDRWRIYKVEERLRQVNLGGTAVGTGSNAQRKYTYRVIDTLRELTGIGLARSEYPMDLTQNNDVFVEVSGFLKTLAVNLIKISTDLRLMNSGPRGGLGEITLEALQAGSSIMPGKVNPVIPEMVTQAAMRVIANDTAISMAAAGGNFELNAFLPLIADSLLESLSLLCNAVSALREKCIDTLTPNRDKCMEHLTRSSVLATALVPLIGYDAAAALLEECGEDLDKIKRAVLKDGLIEKEVLEKVLSYKQALTYMK